jgi:hypothetical protein
MICKLLQKSDSKAGSHLCFANQTTSRTAPTPCLVLIFTTAFITLVGVNIPIALFKTAFGFFFGAKFGRVAPA